MKNRYKLGDRILFLTEDGIEHLATVTSVSTCLDSTGTLVIYQSNKIRFEESQVLGRVMIQKPRAKKQLSSHSD
jgi:hypothetical protein